MLGRAAAPVSELCQATVTTCDMKEQAWAGLMDGGRCQGRGGTAGSSVPSTSMNSATRSCADASPSRMRPDRKACPILRKRRCCCALRIATACSGSRLMACTCSSTECVLGHVLCDSVKAALTSRTGATVKRGQLLSAEHRINHELSI